MERQRSCTYHSIPPSSTPFFSPSAPQRLTAGGRLLKTRQKHSLQALASIIFPGFFPPSCYQTRRLSIASHVKRSFLPVLSFQVHVSLLSSSEKRRETKKATKNKLNSRQEKKKCCSNSSLFQHGWKPGEKRGGGVGKRCFGVCFFFLLGSPPRCFDQLLFPLLCQKNKNKTSPCGNAFAGSAFVWQSARQLVRTRPVFLRNVKPLTG